MTEHKFKVGSRVSLTARSGSAGTNSFHVVRLLPVEGRDPQYRIKSQAEPVERVVKEYQLKLWPN